MRAGSEFDSLDFLLSDDLQKPDRSFINCMDRARKVELKSALIVNKRWVLSLNKIIKTSDRKVQLRLSDRNSVSRNNTPPGKCFYFYEEIVKEIDSLSLTFMTNFLSCAVHLIVE